MVHRPRQEAKFRLRREESAGRLVRYTLERA
jgi:hypothetical protein